MNRDDADYLAYKRYLISTQDGTIPSSECWTTSSWTSTLLAAITTGSTFFGQVSFKIVLLVGGAVKSQSIRH